MTSLSGWFLLGLAAGFGLGVVVMLLLMYFDAIRK